MKKVVVHIDIEQDEAKFKAIVEVLGITAYGDTQQEAILNAQKAIIAKHIQVLKAAEAAGPSRDM